MGCSPSNSSSNKGDKDNSSSSLVVQLVNPVNQQIVELKYSSLSSKKEDYLMNIMNSLFFADDKNSKIDVCFNSLYSQKDDRFHYYLYRLLNVEMENVAQPYAGKMWVVYIQNKPMDWDQIVNSNQKYDFSKGGKIIWRYEKFSLTSSEHLSVYHELSQEHNLDYLKNVGKYQNQLTSESQSNITTQKQSRITSNQLSQQLMQDKSTADHTQVSSLKRPSQEQEEISKRKFNNNACGTLDAPSSIFNPDIQGHPNTKKLLVTENSHIYSNNINYLNTEDEVRQVQPPLHTEAACPIENSDYRNVFDTQNNDDSVVPDKNLLQSFNGTKKSYQIPGGSIYQRNSSGYKDQLITVQSERRKDGTVSQYYEGDENIKSEKESSRKNPTTTVDQKNLQCSNTLSYKFQENCDYNKTIELKNPK